MVVWFAKSGRSFPWRQAGASRYFQVVSEVLLQRTKAETVAKFIPGFVSNYPSWRALARASIYDLENSLHSIGLWRRRSLVLKMLAVEIARRGGRFPSGWTELTALPGVGHYVANAILVFCHGVPAPLLDSGMARVLERCFGQRKLADIRYDPYLNELATRVVDCPTVREVNWGLLDIAAKFCKLRHPSCGECPVASLCMSFAKGSSEVRS